LISFPKELLNYRKKDITEKKEMREEITNLEGNMEVSFNLKKKIHWILPQNLQQEIPIFKGTIEVSL